MSLWDDIKKGASYAFSGKPLLDAGKWVAENADEVGEFFLGSDPGEESRDVLTDFGRTGRLGGQSQDELLSSVLGSEPAQATMDASERLARGGLLGSGKAEQTFQGIGMKRAEDLQKVRLAMLDRKLRALGIGASAQPQPGLVQSAAPMAASYFGG